MFGMGFPELMLIFVIALIVFGPKKLPELGRSIGRAMAEFKKASQEFQDSMQAEMKEVEKSADLEEIKKLGKLEIPDYDKPEQATPAAGQAEEHKEPQQQELTQQDHPKKNEETKANG